MGTLWPTPPDVGDFLQTEEMISGCCAVAISPSGNLRIAMAGLPGRMPAVGICPDNWNSGDTAFYKQYGSIQLVAGQGQFDILGRGVWLAQSGQFSTISGGWLSGGFVSGMWHQRLGVSLNSGGMRIHISPEFNLSGALAFGGR